MSDEEKCCFRVVSFAVCDVREFGCGKEKHFSVSGNFEALCH